MCRDFCNLLKVIINIIFISGFDGKSPPGPPHKHRGKASSRNTGRIFGIFEPKLFSRALLPLVPVSVFSLSAL